MTVIKDCGIYPQNSTTTTLFHYSTTKRAIGNTDFVPGIWTLCIGQCCLINQSFVCGIMDIQLFLRILRYFKYVKDLHCDNPGP